MKTTCIAGAIVVLTGLIHAQASLPPKLIRDKVTRVGDEHGEDSVVYAAQVASTEIGGAVVYDNGTTNPNTDSGNEMSQWVQADDFELASATTLTGANVEWFDTNFGRGWDGGIEWLFFADAGGSPGALLDLGAGIVLDTTLFSNANGWDWFSTSFAFDHPFPVAANTRYWFALHWTDDHDYFRDQVYWAFSQEQHFSTSRESLFGEFDNWADLVGEDRSFRLFAESACTTLDFTASDQGPLAHGQDLETPEETFGCVSIAGAPINAGPAGNAGAAIFDSTNGPAGQDPDLMVDQGNVLILQNNQNAQVLTKSDDFYVHPNDDHNGGTLTFTFCEPADAATIDLIDIDDANGPGVPDGASVVLTDLDGFTHTITVPDGWTGNTDVGTLDLKTLAPQPGVIGSATASEQAGYDGGLVVSIAVTLQSSGAVDNLSYCPNGPGAQAVVRNGSGGNPTILRPVSLPVIGRTWRANLDCSAYDSGVALVVVSQLPSAGTPTPFGEALIAGAIVHRTTQAYQRSLSRVTWSIPFDMSLCGLEVHAQGLCKTSASPFKPKLFFLRGRLSNAVDLVLGF